MKESRIFILLSFIVESLLRMLWFFTFFVKIKQSYFSVSFSKVESGFLQNSVSTSALVVE